MEQDGEFIKYLSKMQEAYDKANAIGNAIQLMQTYDNADRIKRYLILSAYYGIYGNNVQTYIAQCDAICNQCKNSMNALANKVMQDAIMSRMREIAIEIVK